MRASPAPLFSGFSKLFRDLLIINIFEWNGHTFQILGKVAIKALRQTQIADINGLKEISFSGDNPASISCANYIPQRQRIITLSWNGREFEEASNEFEPPEYRFQAIQDADVATVIGKYDKAILLYNRVVSDDGLKWWSPDRLIYEQTIHDPIIAFIATPSATPTEDFSEYPCLAAYAYYHIMLLHFAQGNDSEAAATYQTLQEKFGDDPYGRSYVEMAAGFWAAYQSTHKMYDGCAATIQYAVEHPEILMSLGSDYHGSQSHIYVPADVCPFR